MNTGGVRSNNGNGGSRVSRPRRRARSVRPVVVVAPPRGARRRTRRRRNGGRNRRGRNGVGGRSSNSETFIFNKDSIKDSSSGSITFGPSLSESVALSGGVLKAYHEYKITMVNIRFISESSSTAEGSIAYELDPHCKLSSLQSTLRKFPVTKGGQATFRAAQINGVEWHDTTEDQFRLLYKGNGTKGVAAGFFQIRYTVQLHNPK
uniref:Coat protein n=2 Tax=Tobacco vein distorting virus TaxID=192203 RepID=Q5NJA6_9VIRU|nr:coat protein [Tobacco vein distorting virus]WMI39130.1 coat protein [Tobacco vein distorting virus]CAG28953.1 coat protein [Tobacco vein distorting virus]